MQHLVIWAAWVSPNVTLFLQLCQTSCRKMTDMCFSAFVAAFISNCLFFFLLRSYFSFFHLPSLSSVHLLRLWLRLSPSLDLSDNLAMDDFTFQEQLLTPRLATAGMGGVSSLAAPLWRSYLVPILSLMLSLFPVYPHWPMHSHHLFPLGFSTKCVECDKPFFGILVPDIKFSGSAEDAWTTENATFLFICLNKNLFNLCS